MHPRAGRMAWAMGVGGLVLALAAPAWAAPIELWTITPVTLTANEDQSSSTTFTVTNLSMAVPPAATVIGCVRLNVPNSVSLDAGAMVSPTDGSWTATLAGGGVDLRASNAGARLAFGETMRFSITITPSKTGAFQFAARAFETTTCAAPQFGGSNNVVVTVLPPVPPTPVPTATPTPSPKPLPTTTPLPTDSPRPTPAPTARPTGTGTPAPTPPGSPSAPAAASAPPPGTPSPAAPTDNAPGLSLGPGGGQEPDELLIDIGTGTGLDGIAWTVPAVALGSPGIAVMAWVALQTASGVIWLPWVRRLRRSRRQSV